MDLSKFKTPDWLMVGGGVGFLIFGTFFDWLTAEGASAFNAFDFFFTGTVPWILVVGVGVVAFLLAGGILKPSATPWPLILLLAAALAALLVLLRLLFPAMGEETGGVDVGRGIGLILSAVSAVVSVVGAYLNFAATGGNLKDLTDPDKLKGAFRSGGGSSATMSPPPPPPPSSSPPPPPPPPSSPPPPPAT